MITFARKMTVLGGVALAALALDPMSADAASIVRSDFGASAVTLDFGSGTAFGEIAASGGVLNASPSVPNFSGSSYYDGGDASPIRFDFASAVSRIGMDFLANNANITLSAFDDSDSLLDSVTLDWTLLPKASGYPYGFIGLDVGANLIAYATIDTPRNGNELYVDNATYETSPVPLPLPAGMILLGMGALGILGARRKQA